MSRFDDILAVLGVGRWNLLVFVAAAYWTIHIPFHSIGGALITPEVPHTCRPPPHLPITHASQCSYNFTTHDGGSEERPCTTWDYDNTIYTTTITSEFSLVCDNRYLRPAFKSLYFFGAFFGALVNGILADKYGRRKMLGVSTVSYSLLANGLCWLPNITAILAFRFLLGLMHTTSLHCNYTLAMEVCESRYRTAVGVLLFLPWTLSVIALGGYAYLLRDWRWLMFALSLPSLLFLPALLFLDESPRWLIVKGRHHEALKVLQKAARWNHVTLPPQDQLYQVMHDIQAEQLMEPKSHSDTPNKGLLGGLATVADELLVLFRTPRIRFITLSLYADYLVLGTVYYGLSLGGDKFGVDPFLYMTLSGVMELPGSTLTIPLMEKLGRRTSNVICFFATAVALLVLGATPSDMPWLVTTMALLGKLMISAAYQIITLHATELLPTEVRARGMGTGSMVAKVGSIAAPFLVDVLGSLGSWVPLVVFGGGGVLAGLVTMRLPETRGAPLYDTVAALEHGARTRMAPRTQPEVYFDEKETFT